MPHGRYQISKIENKTKQKYCHWIPCFLPTCLSWKKTHVLNPLIFSNNLNFRIRWLVDRPGLGSEHQEDDEGGQWWRMVWAPAREREERTPNDTWPVKVKLRIRVICRVRTLHTPRWLSGDTAIPVRPPRVSSSKVCRCPHQLLQGFTKPLLRANQTSLSQGEPDTEHTTLSALCSLPVSGIALGPAEDLCSFMFNKQVWDCRLNLPSPVGI